MKISADPNEPVVASAPLYPAHPGGGHGLDAAMPAGTSEPQQEMVARQSAQQFRLQKVGEIETFLCAEVESRSRLNKKYSRAVNALDSTCGTLGVTCITTGAVGAGLLASGIGFVPGLALEIVTGAAGLLDAVCVVVSRRCAVKAAKHEAVRVLAVSKLNSATAIFQRHWRIASLVHQKTRGFRIIRLPELYLL